MSAEFIFRILGMIVFAIGGALWGSNLGNIAGNRIELYSVVMGLIGALAGLVLTPFLTTRPIIAARNVLGRVSSSTFFAIIAGLVMGLVVAALISFPLSLLPPPLGQYLPIGGALALSYLGIVIFAARHEDIATVTRVVFPNPAKANGAQPPSMTNPEEGNIILLDTSVIIDGRILDISRTGFIPETLLIPRFVLNELQYIADSADSLRRQRGRRGMDILSGLQKEIAVKVKISDIDIEGVHPVDEKLILLGKQLHCPILTNDYNMNRVAELQGVKILNINELANAIKAVVLPGEPLTVKVIQAGKEPGQGVGYLEDGTMIVIEKGSTHIAKTIETTVTKVLQTAAGRMIFAKPSEKK